MVSVAPGPDGAVWAIALSGLARIDPVSHAIATYPPEPTETEDSSLALGPDGRLWATAGGTLVAATVLPPDRSVVAGTVELDRRAGVAAGVLQYKGSLTGPFSYTYASLPMPGQVAYLDLLGDGRLDPGDPSATTDASGFFQIPTAAGTYTVRLADVPGDLPGDQLDAAADGRGVPVVVAAGAIAQASLNTLPTAALLPLSAPVDPFDSPTPDPATADATGLYRTILGRAPEPAGLAASVAAIESGMSVARVAADLLASPEHDATTIRDDYSELLGHVATPAEVAAWLPILQGGMTAERGAAAFLDSDVFAALHPDPASFVGAVYLDLLGRQAATAEVLAWESSLAAGTTRPAFVDAVLRSPKADRRAVQGIDSVFYARPGDPAGVARRVALIEAGMPIAGLAATVAGSAEFAARALGTVRREATTTVLAVSSVHFLSGDRATFIAVVVPDGPTNGEPITGNVSFVLDGTSVLATVPVTTGASGLATARLDVSAADLGVDVNEVTAGFSAGVADFSSISASVSFDVGSIGTTLTASVVTPPVRAFTPNPVTFMIEVNPFSPGFGSPTGLITIADASGVLGQAKVVTNSAGITFALFTAPTLPDGCVGISFAYSGDPGFGPSLTSLDVRVGSP